jgi:hypothetical protein
MMTPETLSSLAVGRVRISNKVLAVEPPEAAKKGFANEMQQYLMPKEGLYKLNQVSTQWLRSVYAISTHCLRVCAVDP